MNHLTLAVAGQKGGVGKTTLSLNLGFALAQRGWRTLLVDTDPQGCIGLSLRGTLRERAGLVEVLERSTAIEDAIVETRLSRLQLLPLGQLPADRGGQWSSSLADGEKLRTAVDDAHESWDVTIFDTPPGMAGVTLGVLRCVDFVLVPLQAEPLAARSVSQLLDVIAALREEGVSIEIAGLVLTMLQSRQRESLRVAMDSWRLFPPNLILEATVPRDPVFLEASAEGVPVGLLRNRPPAVAAVFDQLAAELEEILKLEVPEDERRAISLLD